MGKPKFCSSLYFSSSARSAESVLNKYKPKVSDRTKSDICAVLEFVSTSMTTNLWLQQILAADDSENSNSSLVTYLEFSGEGGKEHKLNQDTDFLSN